MGKGIAIAFTAFIVLGLALGAQNKSPALTDVLQPNKTQIPPGVGAELWVPVSDNLGIALTSRPLPQAKQPAISGRFMVRVNGIWQALSVDSPVVTLPVRSE